jgi:hypothetical protein
MPHWINQPWQRNLSKTASGKPGAVQSLTITDTLGFAGRMVPAGSQPDEDTLFSRSTKASRNACQAFGLLLHTGSGPR